MLVTAIMPTRGRPQYAAEAYQGFLSQTYQDKELVIIDDADDPSFAEPLITEFAIQGNIHYHRLKHRMTVGAKRNLACSRASGEVICHWDDDDYSAPERMADQYAQLKENDVEVVGYSGLRFLDVQAGEWWKYTGRKHYALGTSLMYTKAFWRTNRFPDINVGEDTAFEQRISKIFTVDAGLMMFARDHGGNTDKREGKGKTAEWTKCA